MNEIFRPAELDDLARFPERQERTWHKDTQGDWRLSDPDARAPRVVTSADLAKPDDGKSDAGKPRWSLLPWEALARVVDVLEYGAGIHGEQSWRKIPDARKRYQDALLRHQTDILRGETHDPESGMPHTWHVATNALFLAELGQSTRIEKERRG